MTPAWIADNWTGAILQPEPLADQDQDAWLIVRVAPALGPMRDHGRRARRTVRSAPTSTGYVTVTGHFDDPAADDVQVGGLRAGARSGAVEVEDGRSLPGAVRA